ncbi:tetratricopeptide repeat protein [Mucilaginibacter celer]|uniref:Tetratricopeptide repeat protein n=1 Tax=Mucilaginibacter celer TaxID=2305508 RepID=A0A494VR10_9SPHI|nr:hypothetical protein [Mucilaginibacter celer]AYL95780.1 hypothetical protein HYN43_010990 [Mucilaginibacter celer]
MDNYYSIEEKYLQAVDELSFGETPKGLNILNQIIADEPFYARAHYQLGMIHYYKIQDYQTAGYHFKTCMELEPAFPDNYTHYLDLVIFLNMEKQVSAISAQALTVAGVNKARIYELMGLFHEKQRNWNKALTAYQDAFMEVTEKDERKDIEESLKRVRLKMKQTQAYTYVVIE